MQGLILMSVMIATFAIPALTVRWPARDLYRSVLAQFVAFVGVYVFLLLFVYPRLF